MEGEDESDTKGETGKEEGLSRNVEETGKKLERLEIQQDKKRTQKLHKQRISSDESQNLLAALYYACISISTD